MYKFIAQKMMQKKIDILMERKEEERKRYQEQRKRYQEAKNRPQRVQVRYVPQPIPPPVMAQTTAQDQAILQQTLSQSSNQPIQKFDQIVEQEPQIRIGSFQIFPLTNLLMNVISITLFIIVNTSYYDPVDGVSIAANTAYITAVVIAFFYGVRISSQHYYPCMEKCGFIFTFLWPKLKYYALKQRTTFEVFYLNIHCMLIVDLIITCLYVALMSLYIVLALGGFWQTAFSISNFIFLVIVTISRISMMIQVYPPFKKAARELGQ